MGSPPSPLVSLSSQWVTGHGVTHSIHVFDLSVESNRRAGYPRVRSHVSLPSASQRPYWKRMRKGSESWTRVEFLGGASRSTRNYSIICGHCAGLQEQSEAVLPSKPRADTENKASGTVSLRNVLFSVYMNTETPELASKRNFYKATEPTRG